jgi:tight adherence protein B
MIAIDRCFRRRLPGLAGWLSRAGRGRGRARWRRVLGPTQAVHAAPARGLRELVERRSAGPVIAGMAGVLGALLGGPVAGAVLAVYGGAGWVLARRRARERRFMRERVAAIDTVCTLAAELRAGLPAPVALAAAGRELGDPPDPGTVAVADRLTSALALAETSGAPLADVLDRLDAHLRSVDRARRAAQAQAAGATASAALLAVLPVAGMGLGYLVGVDPTRELLHTAVGAACLATAVALQVAGLAWAHRISRMEVPA